MNEAPKKANPVKKFVVKHKVIIAVVATSTAWFVVLQMSLKQHEDFLKERGLIDEFYNSEDSY